MLQVGSTEVLHGLVLVSETNVQPLYGPADAGGGRQRGGATRPIASQSNFYNGRRRGMAAESIWEENRRTVGAGMQSVGQTMPRMPAVGNDQ